MAQNTCETCGKKFTPLTRGARRPAIRFCSRGCRHAAARSRRCIIAGCTRPHRARGWCNRHYQNWSRTGDPEPTAETRFCAIAGCSRPYSARGWCLMHYKRWRTHGDPLIVRRGPSGVGFVTKDGYIRVGVGGGRQVQQHRLVMETMLDRPLEKFETVHHKNGRRADNRPSNLELWTRPQPNGQRPEDLVSWVVEHYRDLVVAELAGVSNAHLHIADPPPREPNRG